MYKYLGVVILFFLITFKANAQNNYIEYYNLINDAHLYDERGSEDSVLISLKSAFELVEYVHLDNLQFGKKVAKKYGDEELFNYCVSSLKDSEKSINQSLQLRIQNLINEDQGVRSNKYLKARRYYFKCINDSLAIRNEKKFNKAKISMQEWWNVDSANIVEVKEIIANHGYPSEEKVGKKLNSSFGLILVHYDKDTSNHIMGDILHVALEEGSIMPSRFAWIMDRHLLMGGQSQKFYAIPQPWIKMTEERRKRFNSNRTSIGLPPINDDKIIVRGNTVIVRK